MYVYYALYIFMYVYSNKLLYSLASAKCRFGRIL